MSVFNRIKPVAALIGGFLAEISAPKKEETILGKAIKAIGDMQTETRYAAGVASLTEQTANLIFLRDGYPYLQEAANWCFSLLAFAIGKKEAMRRVDAAIIALAGKNDFAPIDPYGLRGVSAQEVMTVRFARAYREMYGREAPAIDTPKRTKNFLAPFMKQLDGAPSTTLE
jgi:hypothetical protein